jgi:hypothetical protein
LVSWQTQNKLLNNLAIEAGETLAQILECPFNFVPAIRAAIPEPVEPPLPPPSHQN